MPPSDECGGRPHSGPVHNPGTYTPHSRRFRARRKAEDTVRTLRPIFSGSPSADSNTGVMLPSQVNRSAVFEEGVVTLRTLGIWRVRKR